MAEVRPFKALRFTEKAGDISELCCPPYDIISDEQRLEYIKRNERNIIRLELPRDGENRYAEAARVLKEFTADGYLGQDEKEGFYIYSESFFVDGEQYQFKGIVARVKIEEFSKGIILPHEETLSKAKADRFELMNATMCNFSQIYSLYNDDGTVSGKINEVSSGPAVQSFTDGDGVTHSLWTVTDKATCDYFCRAFADRKLYIADGHHRYETSLNFRNHLREQGRAVEGDECDYVMMFLVDMENDGLVVFPTHRVVHDIAGYDTEKVMDVCKDSFDIVKHGDSTDIRTLLKEKYDNGQTAFALYVNKQLWYMLTLKSHSVLDDMCADYSDALKNLDVNVLHKLILERAFGIDKANMSKQTNLTYTRDISEAISAVDSGDANCCFIMNPTRVTEISAVAAAGEKMPQKSTYFYPKLITGMVMNKFGDI